MLTITGFFDKCGIPRERQRHTHFQWGTKPVGQEQPVRGSLTILDDAVSRRLSIDYSISHEDGRTEFFETDININSNDVIEVIEGELRQREIIAFAEFVKDVPLIVCGEA
ncbi:MAG: hypothetical protein Q7K26_01710 [bacterium]|nr:hypothetical protein [bacterium]